MASEEGNFSAVVVIYRPTRPAEVVARLALDEGRGVQSNRPGLAGLGTISRRQAG